MHIIIILAIAAVLGVVGTIYFTKEKEAATTPAPVVETAASGVPNMEDPVDQEYEDGTYAATGTYTSPAGQESMDITVTLKDDVVTAASFSGNATHPTSILNQGKFKAGFEAAVVGKPLDSINLTVVNGSSLTPGGFMDALLDIKADARV